jgi:hypothetical protein
VIADLRGAYGLWFLNQTPDGQWTLLPVGKGLEAGTVSFRGTYFPLSKANAPDGSSPPAATANDRVSTELETGIEHYADFGQLYRLADALSRAGDSAFVRALYRRLSTNSDPEIKLIALSWLVWKGDVSALTEMANEVDAVPNLKMREFAANAISTLRDASPTTIRALGRIASSSSGIMQRSAAEPLCQIHTLGTLPFLAVLLDSPDQETRRYAMRGFSYFVDNLPIVTFESIPSQSWRRPQGPTPYKTADTDHYSLTLNPSLDSTREAAYLQFWKSWWAKMKVQLAPSGK